MAKIGLANSTYDLGNFTVGSSLRNQDVSFEDIL